MSSWNSSAAWIADRKYGRRNDVESAMNNSWNSTVERLTQLHTVYLAVCLSESRHNRHIRRRRSNSSSLAAVGGSFMDHAREKNSDEWHAAGAMQGYMEDTLTKNFTIHSFIHSFISIYYALPSRRGY